MPDRGAVYLADKAKNRAYPPATRAFFKATGGEKEKLRGMLYLAITPKK